MFINAAEQFVPSSAKQRVTGCEQLENRHVTVSIRVQIDNDLMISQ